MRSRPILLIAAPATLLAAAIAAAGPLNPPAGPVAPTHKTLTEVEPRIPISAATTPGDAFAVFNITQPGSYYLTQNLVGAAGKSGIDVNAQGVTIDLNGFELIGNGGLDAITSTFGPTLRNGRIRSWTDDGVQAGSGAMVIGVHVESCGGRGIRVGDNSTVTGCHALACAGIGIHASIGAVITRCMAHNNGGAGISTTNACVITECSAVSNADGIVTGGASVVDRCTSSFNDEDGIQVSGGTTVTGCVCATNGLGAAGGAGILVLNSGSRIDSNTVSGNDRGIDVNNAANWIVRNCARNNTINFDIVAGNDAGPIGTAAASTSPWANLAQ